MEEIVKWVCLTEFSITLPGFFLQASFPVSYKAVHSGEKWKKLFEKSKGKMGEIYRVFNNSSRRAVIDFFFNGNLPLGNNEI